MPASSARSIRLSHERYHKKLAGILRSIATAQEGGGTYAERTVRYRDLSAEGIAEKVRYVVGAMEKRMAEFGMGWKDATATQTYTVHDVYPVFADAIVRRGAARAGLSWHFARPPVIDLEYEMDCRRVMREMVI